MSLFKRKKEKSSDKDELFIELPVKDSAKEKPLSPYVLTPDEISEKNNIQNKSSSANPFEELKSRMLSNFDETQEQQETIKPSFNVNLDFLNIEEKNNISCDNDGQENKEAEEDQLQLSALDDVKGPYPEEKAEQKKSEKDSEEVSLYQTCMPFITEGNSLEPPVTEPLYTLEKVESILGIETENNESEDAGKDLSQTVVFDTVKNNSVDISDIDITDEKKQGSALNETAAYASFTKTMPVIVTQDTLGTSQKIDLSSEIFNKKEETKSFSGMPVSDEEDVFTPDIEYNSAEDTKKVRRYLLEKRRKRFLNLCGSAISVIILSFLILPMFDKAMAQGSLSIVICSLICVVICAFSCFDCFKSLPTLFKKHTSSDVLFCFTFTVQTAAFIFTVVSRLASSVSYYIALLLSLCCLMRNIFLFKRASYILNNFRVLSKSKEKQSITLIDDAPTTFAMAHKAIDGDILIAASKKSGFVENYMKNSTYSNDLDKKTKPVFVFGLIISLLCAAAIGLYHQSLISAVISLSRISIIFCPAMLFGINTLPLYRASKKLNPFNCAVFSANKAKEIERVNAVAIDCASLFPKGSITLKSLNILSPNNLEETISVAAAITKTIKSPLYHIFKSAMDTNKNIKMPKADTIKYEEKMGITGWIGDSRVFIGNRALMLAHEIPVPDMKIDKELLMQGCFPVYLARDGKACALFAVTYTPMESIAKELRKITNTGITVLINNCDQNISEEMLCDYFDVYEDSLKIMSGSGVHMYKNATAKEDSLNSGAVISNGNICKTVSCCVKIKRSAALLSFSCIFSMLLGAVIFAYRYLGTSAVFLSGTDILLYELIGSAVTYIAYLFTRP